MSHPPENAPSPSPATLPPPALEIDFDRLQRRRGRVAFVWAWIGCALSMAVLVLESARGLGQGPGLVDMLVVWAVLGVGGGLLIAIPITAGVRNRPRARALALIFGSALLAALPWAPHWTSDWCVVAWLATVATAVWSVRRSPLRPRLAGPPRCAACGHAMLDTSARCPECGAIPQPVPPLLSRRRLAPLALPLAAIAVSWALALGTMGPPGSGATVDDLRGWIESDNRRVQWAGRHEFAKRDVALVRPFLTDPSAKMRVAALEALDSQGALTPAEVFRALDDPSLYVAGAARRALQGNRWFGPDDEQAIRDRLATETNSTYRELLERALVSLDPLAWRGATTQPEGSTAAAPAPAVQRMLDRYRSCTSYRDRWTGTRTSTRGGKTTVAALEIATCFDVHGGFRWSRTLTEADGAVTADAICSPDLRVWTTASVPKRGGTAFAPRERASAGQAFERLPSADETIPVRLLFPTAPKGTLRSQWRDDPNFILVRQEPLDGRPCDVLVAQETPGRVVLEKRITLWVDDQGSIRRIASRLVYDNAAMNDSTAPDLMTIEHLADISAEFDTPIPAANFDCAP